MQNTFDAILRLLEVSTACVWPLTFLLIVFLFRRQLAALLSRLENRLKRAEAPGARLGFEVAIDSFKQAIAAAASEFQDDPEQFVGFVREQVRKLPGHTETALQPRALLAGKSMLWVDDNPAYNLYESGILERLGARVVRSRTTEEARIFLQRLRFDLIISDLKRIEEGRENATAGYDLLDAVTASATPAPVVFYIRDVKWLNRERTKAAYGAAENPEDLLALVLEALEMR